MRKRLLKTVLTLLPVLLFVHQRGYAQCTLTPPANVSVVADAGKCGAVVSYTAPAASSGCNVLTNTFAYTGDVQTFVVPAGVTSVTVQTWGAQGGRSGGLGGYAAGTLAVQPGDVLYVYVGGQGTTENNQMVYPGGYNGGGSHTQLGGGGGGASDVRAGGNSLSNRVIVAGGGGGALGSRGGGAGGGLTGTNGDVTSDNGYIAAGGGTQTAGGSGGTNADTYGGSGSFGQGGGATQTMDYACGGGGGYYGGGGSRQFGGGGGGSGYVGGVTASSMQTGVNSGNGKVEIAYTTTTAPTFVQTGGLQSGALFPVGTTINTFALVASNGDTLSKCSSTITVTGGAKPSLTCPANTTVAADAGKCGAVVTYAAPVASSGCSTQKIDSTFAYTGTQQTFVVPAGVTSVTIQTWGAQGGGSDGDNTGGLGGYAAGTLAVQPGDVLYVYVGGQPIGGNQYQTVYPGGYNGGGSSSWLNGGGGGASDVRAGGNSLSNRVIVAGGGGGGSRYTGGAGGGLTGTDGGVTTDYSQFGDGHIPKGGGGGTQTEGGLRGHNGNYPGSLGQGGGSDYDDGWRFNAGGGGGYYGGGGAGGEFAAGGGGSGYVGGVTESSMQTGVNSGNGKVIISCQALETLSVVQTAGLSSGALFPVGTTTNTFALVNSNGDKRSECSSAVTVTDNEKPVLTCPAAQTLCNSNNGSYTIPVLGATDNCNVKSTAYSIKNASGTIARTGTTSDASGTFSTGINTITWTVTDVHGNQSTCQTTVTVNPQITVFIPDVKVLSKGVDANTVYVGYAPAATITLSATTGGSGTLRYRWSNGATTQSIKVSPATNTTYTVMVTNSSNCTATASKQVKVVNVSCGGTKVNVCHSGGTLCIDKGSVPVHLSHGDKLGKCGITTTTLMNEMTLNKVEELSFAAGVYPNPTKGAFTLQLNNQKAGLAQVLIWDNKGAVVQHKTATLVQGAQSIRFTLQGKAAGLYLLQVRGEAGVQTFKVYLQ